MNRWTRHRLFVLLLGMFVTLSMGLSNVAANTMTLKMPMTSTMASDMTTNMGNGGSKDCGDCGSADSKAMVCTAGCVAPIPSALGQTEVSNTETTQLLFAAVVFRLTSLTYPPDPYPPRSSQVS